MDGISFEPVCNLSAINILRVVSMGDQQCLLYVVEVLLQYSTSSPGASNLTL